MQCSLDAFYEGLDRVDATLPHTMRPLRRLVTTMTLTAHMSGFTVPFLYAREFQNTSLDVVVEQSKFARQALKMTSSDLFGSASIKVFPNGSIHMTGCKTYDQCLRIVQTVCDVLQEAFPDQHPHVERVTLNMINLGITGSQRILLGKLAEACRQRGVYAEQPEKPPSCIVRHTATVLAYTSGKMVITGGSPEKVLETYALMYDLLQNMVPHNRAFANENTPAMAARFLRSDTTLMPQ